MLQPNSKFPDMKALADYVHAKGLKFGIYSSPGPITCAGFVGSHGFEEQDARTFAQWGVDFLKYDWCGAAVVYATREEMVAVYQKMGEALREAGRPIVYSICQYGLFDVGSWGRAAGGNLWRTGVDSIEGDLWQGVNARFDRNGRPENSGPGGWNDADMMLVGHSQLNEDEWRFHFTLWAMSASPLILGNDLRDMPPTVVAILSNQAVIAIDQDRLGIQGRKVAQQGAIEVWSKPLAGGEMAVAIFNRGESHAEAAFEWQELGLPKPAMARDLWVGTMLESPDSLRASLPRHGSALWRIDRMKPASRAAL